MAERAGKAREAPGTSRTLSGAGRRRCDRARRSNSQGRAEDPGHSLQWRHARGSRLCGQGETRTKGLFNPAGDRSPLRLKEGGNHAGLWRNQSESSGSRHAGSRRADPGALRRKPQTQEADQAAESCCSSEEKSGVFKARFSGREYRHHSDHRLFLPHDLAHHGHLGAGLPDPGRVC